MRPRPPSTRCFALSCRATSVPNHRSSRVQLSRAWGINSALLVGWVGCARFMPHPFPESRISFFLSPICCSRKHPVGPPGAGVSSCAREPGARQFRGLIEACDVRHHRDTSLDLALVLDIISHAPFALSAAPLQGEHTDHSIQSTRRTAMCLFFLVSLLFCQVSKLGGFPTLVTVSCEDHIMIGHSVSLK